MDSLQRFNISTVGKNLVTILSFVPFMNHNPAFPEALMAYSCDSSSVSLRLFACLTDDHFNRQWFKGVKRSSLL